AGGAIKLCDDALDGTSLLFFRLKYIAFERFGFDFRSGARIQSDLHAGCHRFLTPPVFVHRVAHLAPSLFVALGLAAVPFFLAARAIQLEFTEAIAKIDAKRDER